MIQRIFTAIMLALTVATSAWAMDFPAPKSDYGAVRVVSSSEGTFNQKIHVAGEKMRSEMTMEGMQMITIVRPDRQVAWMLMPAYGMYQEIDLRQAERDRQLLPTTPEDDAVITLIGPDVVDGVATTQYRMEARDKSSEGFIWLNKDNIPVRMEVTDKMPGGKNSKVVMTLQELQMGKQDPALFELPAGMSKMPSMGEMGTLGRR